MKHLKKLLSWMCAVVLIGGLTLCTSCTSNKDTAPSVEALEFIPKAPDYNDASMWVTAEGETDTGVTICYNTVKDVKYIKPIISASDICINPVNWRTDATPATLHDTITVTVSPAYHVLVVSGYSGSEYSPYKDLLNVGDIHSCEPWLYSECLAKNIAVRTKKWREKTGN